MTETMQAKEFDIRHILSAVTGFFMPLSNMSNQVDLAAHLFNWQDRQRISILSLIKSKQQMIDEIHNQLPWTKEVVAPEHLKVNMGDGRDLFLAEMTKKYGQVHGLIPMKDPPRATSMLDLIAQRADANSGSAPVSVPE